MLSNSVFACGNKGIAMRLRSERVGAFILAKNSVIWFHPVAQRMCQFWKVPLKDIHVSDCEGIPSHRRSVPICL